MHRYLPRTPIASVLLSEHDNVLFRDRHKSTTRTDFNIRYRRRSRRRHYCEGLAIIRTLTNRTTARRSAPLMTSPATLQLSPRKSPSQYTHTEWLCHAMIAARAWRQRCLLDFTADSSLPHPAVLTNILHIWRAEPREVHCRTAGVTCMPTRETALYKGG